MFNPKSTYRIQFNKDFTFADFNKNLEFLLLLAPETIYASPIFEAAPGSMHGYDITDPYNINPEIGTYDEFTRLSEALRKAGKGWLQDIVPNHMAFHVNNKWLMDVLENGRQSEFAGMFDIDFDNPELKGKILVPFLGKPVNEALNDKELLAGWKDGNFNFTYFDSYFPFSFESFRLLMIRFRKDIPEEFAVHLNNRELWTPGMEIFPVAEWNEIKTLADRLYRESISFKTFIGNIIDEINSGGDLARNMLEEQNYRLAWWQESSEKMNYRRFFTVNGLICLRMEDDFVFKRYHKLIANEVKESRFNGLRIDHIDGLKDPALYVENLRLLAGKETYIVAEKILGLHEDLPSFIQLQGTSGYDYLGIVNNLFTCRKNYSILKKFYKRITGITRDVEDIITSKKRLILTGSMNGEWENLTRMFDESGFLTYGQGITRESMKDAIGEFLVCFPVYKIYADYFPLSDEETRIVRHSLEKATKNKEQLSSSLNVLENVFIAHEGFDEEKTGKALAFLMRCMQFAGPLTAKGVEDTTMYNYNCFIAHNEVGDNPGSDGISIDDYHRIMTERQRYFPLTMNATSTHDTKRGEDVRARLNVLSEMPAEWMTNVEKWMEVNKELKSTIKGKMAPDNNEEYFLYQTLIGSLPFDTAADESYLSRLDEYIVKALRESKTNSDWNEPDTDYEEAVKGFVRNILSKGSSFLESFMPFQQLISEYGIINSLSQLVLKATSPGVPDFYQGSELWDLSLVDPDNRRPVDYEGRLAMLKKILRRKEEKHSNIIDDLYKHRHDGSLKLWLTYLLLKERSENSELFVHGSYMPLEVTGKHKEHILAYARVYENKWFITIVPLFWSLISRDSVAGREIRINWLDTAVVLPEYAPRKLTSSLTKDIEPEGSILLSDIMKVPYPVFFKGERQKTNRYAGVLCHITSLPGKYGTGDLGEEAFDMADRLQENGQRFWQILPFNPTGAGYGYSPYSSISAFAGNTMFLNPDLLVKSRFMSGKSLNITVFQESDRTDFKRAMDFREMISDEVFTSFFCHKKPFLHKEFEDFCEREKFWLDDYSLFVVLKKEFKDSPWNKWPVKVKSKDNTTLSGYVDKYQSEIKKEKLSQFLFQQQWTDLKRYCNFKGIKLIGDISFYVNYDSAEVWAHPQNFKLDRSLKPIMVAGVPPDYFSESGQLWNMPVYNWELLKKNNYDWWIERIKRNIELCDFIRFDHFRGFSAYWEVPYGEKTAINGEWIAGPGNDFFSVVKENFPGMPFIAEDLGTIDAQVVNLKNDFSLPGMLVLQFAFGDNTPHSEYIPHNHRYNNIVYTGTHDNNTTKGWFNNELSEKNREEAAFYTGHPIDGYSCSEDFIRMAYSSVAKIAIIPVQDFLGLDASARLNKPSIADNNWTWKMQEADLKNIFSERIRMMVKLFGRI
jgi:malto-oligosyltrehalose synthase/4-alpha-glucanotransferase